eukprot:497747-Ditylum_brightwellii.AAC.1
MKPETEPKPMKQISTHFTPPKRHLNIMQIVLISIAHIEQNGGLLSSGLYKDTLSVDEVQECTALMMQSKSLSTVDFTQYSDMRIIAAALKVVLISCQLVPCEFIPSIMEITDGSEIEEIVASSKWDALKSTTFLALLRHLANVARFEASNGMSSLELGNIFGDILLREQTTDPKICEYDVSSIKSKGRRISLIIRYLAEEGNQFHDNGIADKMVCTSNCSISKPALNNEVYKNKNIDKSSQWKQNVYKQSEIEARKNSHDIDSSKAKGISHESEYEPNRKIPTKVHEMKSRPSLSQTVPDNAPIYGRVEPLYLTHDAIVEKAKLRIMRAELVLERPVGPVGRSCLVGDQWTSRNCYCINA